MTTDTRYPLAIQQLLAAWRPYIDSIDDWQRIAHMVEPMATGCGPVYELANPLHRPDEDFSMCDMRNLSFAEPHYHPAGNWEIYFVLQAGAVVVLGAEERNVTKGDVIVIPPNTAHFTVPDKDFVIAMVNTPPFKPEIYITLTESKSDVQFDYEQFKRLTHQS
jgi:mannose-6-phosphate isomerase-like protein (cupin superfamily)